MLTNIYCILHKTAKKILRVDRNPSKSMKFICIYSGGRGVPFESNLSKWFVNDDILSEQSKVFLPAQLYFGENTISKSTKLGIDVPTKRSEVQSHRKANDVIEAWNRLLIDSLIPKGWRNSDFCHTGYIFEKKMWCLSSWIWTSAAEVRCFVKLGDIERAKRIADAFLREQLEDGGWVVRYDYSNAYIIPVIAPNDSAYIANNALLEMYLATNDKKYLEAAKRTADWIIHTAREDGLVHMGYNNQKKQWMTDVNIVDIGFTAALFARLFLITKGEQYLDFLQKFVDSYIDAFYDTKVGAFATSINSHGKKQGGLFARGQAWALEGLIPAYCILQSDRLKNVITSTVDLLVNKQLKNGAWPYNFSKVLMGADCKGTPVIAKALLDWYSIDSSNGNILNSVNKSMVWIKANTSLQGESLGCIFSKNVEGAVVHDLYTSTAFVYATAYAIEVHQLLEERKE